MVQVGVVADSPAFWPIKVDPGFLLYLQPSFAESPADLSSTKILGGSPDENRSNGKAKLKLQPHGMSLIDEIQPNHFSHRESIPNLRTLEFARMKATKRLYVMWTLVNGSPCMMSG